MCCPPAREHQFERVTFGLSEKGHRRVLALRDPEKLRDFIERVVGQLDGKIVSQSKFDCFVHWHARASRQVSFEQLKETLKQKTWIFWHDQSLSSQQWKLTTYPEAGLPPRKRRLAFRKWLKQRPPSTDDCVKSVEAWDAREPWIELDVPMQLQARPWPLTEEGYQQALLAGETEMCSFIQQLLVSLGGKVLRKGQLLPFTFWYVRVGCDKYEGFEGLRHVLQEQTWVLFPDDSDVLQAWKGRVSLRHMPARPRSKRWFLGWPERRSGSEWRIAKALDAKFIDPKELRQLIVYAKRTSHMTPEILSLSLRRLGRIRYWQSAFELLHSSQRSRLESSAPYVAVVDVCRTVNGWDQALGWLVDAKEQGLPATNVSNAVSACILRCRLKKGWGTMLELLHNLLEAGQEEEISADEISFGTVLAACSRLHQWQLAIQLVQVMQTSRLNGQASLVPLCSAAAACNRGRSSIAWRWTLHFLSLARWAGQIPNLTLRNCAILAVNQDSHGWQLAMLKLQDLCDARLQPDRVSFSSACAACQRTAAVDQAWQLLKQLPRHSLRACAIFYSSLVMTCSSQMRWQEAATVLPHLKTSMDTRQAFLVSMVKAHYWRQAVHLLEFRKAWGSPSQLIRKADLLPAMQVCRHKGSVSQALELLRDVQQRNWRIDTQMMEVAIGACRKEWNHALVLAMQSYQAGLAGTLTPTLEVCKSSKWRIAALLADRLSSEERKKVVASPWGHGWRFSLQLCHELSIHKKVERMQLAPAENRSYPGGHATGLFLLDGAGRADGRRRTLWCIKSA
eukprot:symbB.v1.2.031147.t1/scaffold3584.1/size53777/3